MITLTYIHMSFTILFTWWTLGAALGVITINFTNCHHPEWSCLSASTEIIYTCSLVRSDDFIIHLKDYYNDNTISLTIQSCKHVRVVLDCPTLQTPSRLQHFKIKDCDRLEFIALVNNSLVQTPPTFTIENVREIVSLPRHIFKTPATNEELKCSGNGSLKKIRIANSKINTINAKAIFNLTQIDRIDFENVTIDNIESEAIDIFHSSDNSVFTIIDSKIDKMDLKAITIQCSAVNVVNSYFGDIHANVLNITADDLTIRGNTFKDINGYGIITNSIKTDISGNSIKLLRANALAGIKCSKRRLSNKEMKFIRNTIEHAEPLSLYFDYASCNLINTEVSYRENKIDCKCRNISYLNSINDFNNIILEVSNNNTCLITACALPVDIVKLLLENNMCHLDLDPQVMCLMYNDKHTNNNEVTTDEDVTDAAPTFYLIRQANSLQDASAAMTAIDKDDLLKHSSNLNVTNRTTVKVVFDSSKDFVETLRSTSRTGKVVPETKIQPREEYVNRCATGQCRNTVTHDKQKALDFYKYVYAQLRTPRPVDNKKDYN